ncbi:MULTISPECIES: hypothetical protein [unclassified Pseudomonas]|uniref:hypothetical protein n=1 Tax=unclassified Pseudomonas TaxID=196821 RepID=UPI00131DB8BA|nr:MULTISPECIES: hypothetical protein [unclassified Pseudomonas]
MSNVIEMPDGSIIIDDGGITPRVTARRMAQDGKTLEQIAQELGAPLETVREYITDGESIEPSDD